MTNQIIIGRKVPLGPAVAGWVLAGCRVPTGIPVATPTATQAPTEPAAASTSPPSETPKPSDTPEPAATATEPGLQREVLEWHRSPLPSSTGWSYVYALLRNPYPFPVEVTGTPTARLLDGDGALAYRSRGVDVFDGSLMGIGQIPPGETVGIMFCACVNALVIPEWETFQFDMNVRQTQAVPLSTDFQLRPTRVLQDDESFAVVFDGTYPGGPPLRAIAVRMTVRDSEGTCLGSGEVGILGDFTTAGYANIEPGDSFGLAVSVYLDPAIRNESLDYELYAVGSLAQP